ncbi:uncharacterized protein C6orf136 homolog [Austrofundulus limnaeus]|uniref:Uncharacterized protein C6orf136 homolog n=1 Tax=Austrofundulus limnaeus TaxID=52670 RepID=A0A2I4CQF6_AUSLI|nr:PREDICTED: uncharacterized protein C6orf136 homolog [Austrofundulus limnaeus]
MAVRRGGISFWVGRVDSHSRRQPIKQHSWTLSQEVYWQWISQPRPLSSAARSLPPPNSLRYQTLKQPLLSHLLHHDSQQRHKLCEDNWEESLGVCLLVPQGESNDTRTLLQLADPSDAARIQKLLHFSLSLTAIDGGGEDDISFESLRRNRAEAGARKHDCFRNLFEAEMCPAPFVHGSRFYCFHCPGTSGAAADLLKNTRASGLSRKTAELLLLPSDPLCSYADREEGQSEEEEKLAIMYERLQVELPNFFMKNHDFNMYSDNMEFINGLINVNTRGLTTYRLILAVWRFLCLCYYAEARLDVLKLTKHMEDRSIKARWRIRGLPMHSVMLYFFRKDKSQLYRSFDAFSTFYIGQDGLIRCHKVEKVMPAQSPTFPRGTSLLTGALVALGMQEDRPALNLLPSLLFRLRHSRN